MKSRFKLFLFVFLLNYIVKGQIIGGCGTSAANSNTSTNAICFNAPLPTGPQGDKNCPYWTNDGELNTYTVNNAMPTLTFNISFHFLTHPTQTTSYGGLTLSQLNNDVNLLITHINNRFNLCGVTPPTAPNIPNASPLVVNPKIQIQSAGVYIHTSVDAITSATYPNVFPTTFTQGLSNSLCLYFFKGPSGAYGYYLNSPIPFVAVSSDGVHTPNTMINADNPDLIWHEICHGIGLLDDHYYLKFFGNYDKANSFWGDKGPTVADYVPDDAALDLAGSTCNPVNNQNNVMGGLCREHLSARQIAAIHFLVAKGVTKKYTQFINSVYPYTPPIYSNNSANYTFSGTTTFTNSFVFNNITITSGSKVTFSNTTLYGTNGSSRIFVEPGAKLILNGVYIRPVTTFTSNYWGGIVLKCGGNVGQGVDANGLGVHGILEMNESSIHRALVGVSVGTDDPAHSFSDQGGGWLIANNSYFIQNRVSLKMFPFPSPNVSIAEDKTKLTKCSFSNNSVYRSLFPGPFHFVELERVKKVKFIECSFTGYSNDAPIPSPNINDPSVGIKGINSSIYVGGSSSFETSSFEQLEYGIHLMNPYSGSNLGTVIQECEFRTKNGIYIEGASYAKIVRNNFEINRMPHVGVMNTGIYLNTCNGYKVERNVFRLFNETPFVNKTFMEGIVVNSSGANINQIYNNEFRYLQQGIWCQNQNWDPSTSFGLKLNCNDFVNCTYNIGVQSGNPTEGLNTGIATVQGAVTPTLETHVRNTYTSTAACNNQNKFWQYTAYNPPSLLFHGNFQQPEFQIGPQPNCSLGSQIINITGVNITVPKSTYCIDQSLLPKAPKSHIFNTFKDLTNSVNLLQLGYIGLLDGGNTSTLLATVNSNISNGNLKNELMSKPFLSDMVLEAYFTKASVPPGHIKQVFEKNAPASANVYRIVMLQNLPNGIKNQITLAQNQNTLSPRGDFLARIAIAKDNQSYAAMHKAMWLMDSIAIGLKDSLATIINLLNQGDVQKQLIELDIEFNNFDLAKQKLALFNDGTLQKANYVEFTTTYLDLLTGIGGLKSLKTNSALASYFEGIAGDETHVCHAKAKVIVNAVFNTRYPELKLEPINNTGARGTNEDNGESSEQIVELSDGISLFPNPTQDQAFVKNGTDESYTVNIMSINGQLLITEEVAENTIKTLNTQNLPTGIYFVNLSKGKSLIKTTKLIIVK